MEIFLSILFIIAMSVLILLAFNFASKRILYKIKANKWVVLTAAIVAFLSPVLLAPLATSKVSQAMLLIPQILFIFLLLWFMDLMGWFKKINGVSESPNGIKRIEHKVNKKDVIKPKAKPNRVKKN